MSGIVSRRTAELALVAFDEALARRRVNGAALPAAVAVALRELHTAAVSPTRQELGSGEVVAAELITPETAAERLGVTVRTVQRWATDGRLPAVRLGRSWAIRWTGEQEWRLRQRQRRQSRQVRNEHRRIA